MYQAIVTINGEQFFGLGKTRIEARNNAVKIVSRSHSGGLASVTRGLIRTSEVTAK